MSIPKDPPDNKPVAWVNSAANSSNNPEGHISEACSVKLLSDGSTVGKVVTHVMDTCERNYGYTFDQTATLFDRDGESKIAQFVVYMVQEPSGLEFMNRIKLIDNGEGKNSDPDAFMWEIWLPEWDPSAPEMWWPIFGPQDPTDPDFGKPLPQGSGNTQVHLPD